MKIVKHSGNIVDFNRNKLKNSLIRSGADRNVVENVLQIIEKQIFEGISTKKIYSLAFSLLKKHSKPNAARYNLRAAIQMLGPAGFFFEKYISRLFESDGYMTQTNLFLQGKCVSHEIDVAIKKEGVVEMVECKFHASKEVRSDVKIPMYILSRYNDLKNQTHAIFTQEDTLSGCWIVTNNRFTSDAVDFAKCSGLKLMSWDYPEKGSLSRHIDKGLLYPMTCLTTLSIAEKDKLLVLDIILAKELLDNIQALEMIDLKLNRIKKVIKEVTDLCKYI